MNKHQKFLTVALVGVALASCSSLPDRIDELENARSEVEAVDRDPLAREEAAVELRKAKQALNKAEQSYAEKDSLEQIKHEAYIAGLHAKVAQEQIDEARAQKRIESGEARRNRVLLEARTTEAERRAREAELARQAASAALEETRRLEAELKDLQAKQTERGLVLTLGDVLFDTNKAELRSGADRTIRRLAEFLDEYPERRVLIEGHTDSRGSEQHNQDLSGRRANAVRDALVNQGVTPSRIRTRGLGEAHPVATNERAAGMQQNRRVEIVISDEKGKFPAAAERTAGS